VISGKRIAKIARRAAEIIQHRGKATGTFMTLDGQVCAVGAVRMAMAEQGLGYEVDLRNYDIVPLAPHLTYNDATKCESAIISAITERIGGLAVTIWSDRHSTKVEDIAKVLGQVADEIEVR